MKVRFFDPGKGYLKIKDEIDAEMQRVLAAGELILRADVEKFEDNLAKYVGTKYAVAVASGTDALVLSLIAAGLEPGDKVAVPSYTFRATIEAVIHAGGVPVIYDNTHKVTFDGIKFWVPAHIAGRVSPIFPHVFEHAKQAGVTVIEDACQAIGAAPVLGVAACYSFYPAKLLGCYGDGGAIATNNEFLAKYLKEMRNHFKPDWAGVGYNSRLDNLQAAVLNVKIKYLPDAIKRRKDIAQMYDEGITRWVKPEPREVYQDYIIECPVVADLKYFLETEGVETMTNGYPFPEGYVKGMGTQEYEMNSLRLPCNENLTDEEVNHVISSINKYGNA